MGNPMSRSAVRSAAAALLVASAALGACTTPSSPSWAEAGCYDSPEADAPDLRFSGSANRNGNLTVSLDLSTFTLSDDGTCSGVPLGEPNTMTLVRAGDEAEATADCVALGYSNGVGQIELQYPAFPSDAWVCNPPPLS